jgi:hypothetical protein
MDLNWSRPMEPTPIYDQLVKDLDPEVARIVDLAVDLMGFEDAMRQVGWAIRDFKGRL